MGSDLDLHRSPSTAFVLVARIRESSSLPFFFRPLESSFDTDSSFSSTYNVPDQVLARVDHPLQGLRCLVDLSSLSISPLWDVFFRCLGLVYNLSLYLSPVLASLACLDPLLQLVRSLSFFFYLFSLSVPSLSTNRIKALLRLFSSLCYVLCPNETNPLFFSMESKGMGEAASSLFRGRLPSTDLVLLIR